MNVATPVSEKRDTTTNIFLVGHSHTVCMARASEQGLVERKHRLAHVLLNDRRDVHRYLSRGRWPRVRRLGKGLLGADPNLVICRYGGNGHHYLSLFQHPWPFDFVYPDKPELPLIDGAQILTYSSVRQHFFFEYRFFPAVISTLKVAFGAPIYVPAAPPPMYEEDAILKLSDTIVGKQLEKYGVSPGSLRYKTWLASNEVLQELCEKNECEFVPTAPEVMTDDGYLASEYWGVNATHGNEKYGAVELNQILARAGG